MFNRRTLLRLIPAPVLLRLRKDQDSLVVGSPTKYPSSEGSNYWPLIVEMPGGDKLFLEEDGRVTIQGKSGVDDFAKILWESVRISHQNSPYRYWQHYVHTDRMGVLIAVVSPYLPVQLGNTYKPDALARSFWDAVDRHRPDFMPDPPEPYTFFQSYLTINPVKG